MMKMKRLIKKAVLWYVQQTAQMYKHPNFFPQ